jgi:hypothetical protein
VFFVWCCSRGVAVFEIFLDVPSRSSTNESNINTTSPSNVYLQGRLSNGVAYEFELGAADPDYVGRKTTNGWYVKASGIIAVEANGEVMTVRFVCCFLCSFHHWVISFFL